MKAVERMKCRANQKILKVMQPILPYREPELLDGIQAVPDILKENKIYKVLLVTDSGIRGMGLTLALEGLLDREGICCSVYDQVIANPTVHTVERALEQYQGEQCQGLIAFGGGSSMDCAKAVGARIACPMKTLDMMKGTLKVRKQIPLLIAVPTTAGTGSETTIAAVITDDVTHHKYPINDFTLIPRYAVLEPEVTLGLPPMLTATTGMDALTHAVEAFIGQSTSTDTRAESIEAVRLIFANIETAYSDGTNRLARKNMLRASYLAGMAFTKSYVGYVHAVAHSLGGYYGTAHGLANAVLLPKVLEYYGEAVKEPLAQLAYAVHLVSEDVPKEIAARQFIKKINELNKYLKIPEVLPEVKEKDIPMLAENAAREGNPLYPVPLLMDAVELQELYRLVVPKKNDTTIEEVVKNQKEYYDTGITRSLKHRMRCMNLIEDMIRTYEKEIYQALYTDLRKSEMESCMCELGLVMSEIRWMKKNLPNLIKNRRVKTPVEQFASSSYQSPTPYGNILVMSPWNYPILLTLEPLVDALAAGNTVIIKPSAYASATAKLLKKMIGDFFPPELVAVVLGGREENQKLLDQKYDRIFFTGSKAVGKEVMKKAAQHLTPVTLELGGKSPVIVDETAELDLAAKRIVFGKYLNCGQTCVAPDYILCQASIKEKLVKAIIREIQVQFGEQPLNNNNYGKIINEKHFHRIVKLIQPDKVVTGGTWDEKTLRITPTVMTDIAWKDEIMQEEIFGPLLPILTYESLSDAITMIEQREHPLALYVFSENRFHQKSVLDRCHFGGGCINDTIIHLATSNMPFGGFGESGMGQYHGEAGFMEFTHYRSIVNKKTWMDLPVRYQPYTKDKKKMIHI